MTGPVTAPGFDDVAARARMVPLLPCGDVDEMAGFWTALGLELTYRQVRPNPCIGLARGEIALQYYGMPEWDPDASHSTCVIAVPDTEPVYQAFAAGLRALHGRLPVSGAPRVTRPRERANNAGLSGFSLVDPAGNWVRVSRLPDDATPVVVGEGGTTTWTSAGGGPLARATENAVVVGDSHGDVAQARKTLAGAVRRSRAGTTAPPVAELAPALAYLVELAVRAGAPDDARATFAELEGLAHGATTAEERAAVAVPLAEASATLRDA
ncbi:hypothetical protein LEP48_18145 [Isoptericola sp. NEAU-Y5]|uniref:VOC family protein n=1 Tax=Isoptericola luteus TaxID=2879484 RepID=A0ABS7ZL80_9MICO|nr:hypothetical protein [Isoptericola sp. NEAU-Y5]MCA5895252.1 hypothetical protein [Isoptericola sp. NEAU-Y5]